MLERFISRNRIQSIPPEKITAFVGDRPISIDAPATIELLKAFATPSDDEFVHPVHTSWQGDLCILYVAGRACAFSPKGDIQAFPHFSNEWQRLEVHFDPACAVVKDA